MKNVIYFIHLVTLFSMLYVITKKKKVFAQTVSVYCGY